MQELTAAKLSYSVGVYKGYKVDTLLKSFILNFKAFSLKITTSFIAPSKLISGYQMVYCAQAECLDLPIWEKLPLSNHNERWVQC